MGEGDGWRACRRSLSTTRVQQTCIGRRGLRQQAALHLCVACRHRRRQISDWRTTSNLNASVSRRRSWIHAWRSTCAVHAAGSGRRGRSSAASARDAVRVCDETMKIRRFHPPRFGPSRWRPRGGGLGCVWLGLRGGLSRACTERWSQSRGRVCLCYGLPKCAVC